MQSDRFKYPSVNVQTSKVQPVTLNQINMNSLPRSFKSVVQLTLLS